MGEQTLAARLARAFAEFVDRRLRLARSTELNRSKDSQGMIGLNQVDPPVHRLEKIINSFVLAYGIGEDFDSHFVATVDDLLGKNIPLSVEGIRLNSRGNLFDVVRTD